MTLVSLKLLDTSPTLLASCDFFSFQKFEVSAKGRRFDIIDGVKQIRQGRCGTFQKKFLGLLRKAYGALGDRQCYEWFTPYKTGRQSIRDDLNR